MRVLLLVSNIVMGAALLANASGVSATSTHKHTVSKNKKHSGAAKQKIVEPANVWRRVSAGLRLPRPDLELAALNAQLNENKYSYLQGNGARLNGHPMTEPVVPELITETEAELAEASHKIESGRLIQPSRATPPKNNYTALGRKLLGNMPSDSLDECNPKKGKLVKFEASKPLNSTRIRTQFNYYPELRKHTNSSLKTLTYRGSVSQESPCAQNDPKKLVRLAQNTPVLPPTTQTDVPQSPQAVEMQMQMLAAKQREQEEQRSTRLIASSERVNKFVNWYLQRRDYLAEVSGRAKPYLYHIVDVLNKRHLPLDLALLPIVESAYQPTALSPMSAAGLWQFIPSTGADYNLKQDAHYDERLDITASTEAAASYLAFLNHRFKGDWLLALAAYNCGIGRVEDAINRNRAEGLDTDYWSLPLPAETQDYVPRLLALSKLMSNPAAYNLKLVPVNDEPHFITVNVDRKLDIQNLADKDLRTIADFANVPYEQFSLLNPGYLEATLPPDRPFNFLLPIANANQLYQRLSMLVQTEAPEQKITLPLEAKPSPQTIQIPEQDQLAYIDPFVSLPVNQLPVIASQPKIEKTAEVLTPPKPKAKSSLDKYLMVHYVDKGETLQTVAKQFEVSVEAVRTLNKLKRKQGVYLGQRLTIPPKQAKSIMLEANNGVKSGKQEREVGTNV